MSHQLTFNRGDMLRGLTLGTRLVKRRNTIPILCNVLVSGSEDAVHLSTTDLDKQVDTDCPADVAEPFALTIPAHALHDFVARTPEDKDIRATIGDGRITLKCGRARCELLTLPAEDYPSFERDPNLTHHFEIDAGALKHCLDAVAHAMSNEETRYYLCGTFLHWSEDRLNFVATDGHRLFHRWIDAPDGLDGSMPSIILPRLSIETMQKMLAGAEKVGEPVRIGLSENLLRMTTGTAILSTKLIDGTFPDYRRIIPAGNDRTYAVPVDALTKALERISVMAQGASRVRFSFTAKRLRLFARDPDVGEIEDEITIEGCGEKTEIGFAAGYVLAVLQRATGRVTFRLGDAGAAALLSIDNDECLTSIIMPVRI